MSEGSVYFCNTVYVSTSRAFRLSVREMRW